MPSRSFSRYFVIRLAAAFAVIVTALPLSGALAGEKSPSVEVDLVDRWEAPDGSQIRGTIMIRLRLRDGKHTRPLANADVLLQSITDPKGKPFAAMTNQFGVARVDAGYSENISKLAGVQIVGVIHSAIPRDTRFGQSFKYHGNPLPAVYVFDSGNSRIQKFTPDGTYLTQWGSQGFGDGQFCPGAQRNLAVDGNANVYATDSCGRVQKFTSYGVYLSQWGDLGDDPGEFGNGIHGIAVDGANRVYVSSEDRIQRFSSNGTFQLLISTSDQTSLPGDLAFDPDGDLWTYDWENIFTVHEYTTGGDYLSSQTANVFGDFAFDADVNFYGSMNHEVLKIAPDWTTTETWGPLGGGTNAAEFNDPEAFAVDSDHLFVLEQGNNRIQILTTDGVFISMFGAFGANAGQFKYPTDMAIYS